VTTKERILSALRGGPMMNAELQAACVTHGGDIGRACADLIASGQVVRADGGTRGTKATYALARPLHSRRNLTQPGCSVLTEIEDQVMNLWEDRLDVEQIALKLNPRPQRVQSILNYMREGKAEMALGEAAVASQTRALLTAICLHHPDRCGS